MERHLGRQQDCPEFLRASDVVPRSRSRPRYDVNGHIDSVTDWRGDNFTMVNDADGRMNTVARLTSIGHTGPGGALDEFAYVLDGRTSDTKTDGTTVGYTVDATGQLVSDTDGTTYTYDAAGNLTGTSAGDSYTYDDYGRVTSVTAGATTQTYGYDAQEVRVTFEACRNCGIGLVCRR